MYNTSENWKNAIYNADNQHKIQIYLDNELVDEDHILGLEIDTKLSDEGFTLGTVRAKQISLTLYNEYSKPSEITLSYGILINGEYEMIPFGTYIVDSYELANEFEINITATDYMSKFNKRYNAESIVPTSLLNVLTNICATCGVELGTQTFTNMDTIINVYDNTISARDYIGYIAEQAGCFAVIGRDNKLYLKDYYQDEETLQLDNFADYEVGEELIVSKTLYEDAIRGYQAGTDTHQTIVIDSGNPYIVGQEQIDNIQAKINGLQIQGFSGKTIIDPALDIGDKLLINDGINRWQTLYQGVLTFGGRWTIELETIVEPETKQTSKISQSESKRILRTEIDQMSGKIILLANTVETVEESVEQVKDDITLTENASENKEFYLTKTADSAVKDLVIYGESYLSGDPAEIISITSPIEITSKGDNDIKLAFVGPTGNAYNEIAPTLSNGVVNVKGKDDTNYNYKGAYQNGFVTLGNTEHWKSNQIYYFSCKIEVVSNQKGLETNRFVAYLGSTANFTITYNEETGRYEGSSVGPASSEDWRDWVEIRIDGCEVNISEAMLTTKNKYTYEPYKSSTTLISLLHDLRSLPNGTRDRVYNQDGKWYDEQKVGSVILNGSENWTDWFSDNGTFIGFYLDNYVNYNNSEGDDIRGISDQFDVCASGHDNAECLGLRQVGDSLRRVYLSIYNTRATNLSEFKAMLSNKPVTLQYELPEPIVTEITNPAIIEALESIKTYKGVTNITSTAPSIITYYRDTQLNEEYETRVNANKQYRITTEKFASQEITNESIINTVSEVRTTMQEDYQTKEEASTQYTQLSKEFEFKVNTSIEDLKNNGVSKVVSSIITIDEEGLKSGRSDSEYYNLMNNVGNYQYNAGRLLAKYDKDGAEIPRLKSDIGVIAGLKHTRETIGRVVHHRTYVIE